MATNPILRVVLSEETLSVGKGSASAYLHMQLPAKGFQIALHCLVDGNGTKIPWYIRTTAKFQMMLSAGRFLAKWGVHPDVYTLCYNPERPYFLPEMAPQLFHGSAITRGPVGTSAVSLVGPEGSDGSASAASLAATDRSGSSLSRVARVSMRVIPNCRGLHCWIRSRTPLMAGSAHLPGQCNRLVSRLRQLAIDPRTVLSQAVP